MAEIRSGARDNSKFHNPDGNLYDRGYQFRYPEHLEVTFGPWESVWPMGERDLPKSILRNLEDGIVRDGLIMALWSRTENVINTAFVLNAQEYPVASDRYHITFFKNLFSGGVLAALYDNGQGDLGTDNSALTPSDTRLATSAWGTYVYVSQPVGGIANTVKYNPVANTWTNAPTIPLSKFLFVLDNNLVYIRQVGVTVEIGWSVDGLPEDMTGVGSGTYIINHLGKVMGVGLLDDKAVIIGSHDAIVMVPTGSADPTFRFMEVGGIKGTPFEYAVASDRERVYYVGYNRQLVAFGNDGVTVEIGDGEGNVNSPANLFYSNRLGLIVLSMPEDNITWFLDPKKQEWVSILSEGWEFVADSPSNNVFGKVFGLRNNITTYDKTILDLDPPTFNAPRFSLGKLDLVDEWHVESVELVRVGLTQPGPLALQLQRVLASGYIDLSDFGNITSRDIIQMGHTIRYIVNAPAVNIVTNFQPSSVLNGPFLLNMVDGAGNITVDYTNPPSGSRGDANAEGNLNITTTATQQVGDSIDVNGNMVTVASSDLWVRNAGIEKVRIRLKNQRVRKLSSV